MAKTEVTAARIKLNRLLGLVGNGHWNTPRGLPFPAATEDAATVLQETALSQRLDLLAMRAELAVARHSLGMVQRYRYLGDLQAGIEYEHEPDNSRIFGPTFAFELPIFNRGNGRILRSRASVAQRQANLDHLELPIKSAVALAHNQVLAARDRVELFRTKFIPSRQAIVAQTQELQNLLIVSPFETQRARNAEFADYIKALGDYWVARIQLVREVGAMLPPTFDESGRLDIQVLVRRHPPAATKGNNDGS